MTANESTVEGKTKVGNYFVSNYPPFSFWNAEQVPTAQAALSQPPTDDRPLGVYVHIPFCRKRCDFCYFKVYTDKNSREIRRYLEGVRRELASVVVAPYLAGRRPRFVYFGGGTPSYLSAEQMRELFAAMRQQFDWSEVEEVTFECEPGTLSLAKIEALAAEGVTRLSLGFENFDPDILERNNRAHRAEEIDRTYGFARQVGFPSINVDLISGMVAETDENWTRCIERTLEMQPDSVTIYQMEVPYNTTLYGRMKETGEEAAPVADWATKRRWTAQAFDALVAGGYWRSSAYTACRGEDTRFVYRDALWHGADMLGVGVSSFSHLAGHHFQNEHAMEPYLARVESGQSPVARALVLGDDERFIREFILQLKLGHVPLDYFEAKFGVRVLERYRETLARYGEQGYLHIDGGEIRLTPEGIGRVDSLLPPFFQERHRNARYA